eukprot:CAMPEP_0118911102 /NCGR_PEP_ID=MMETSP1166-20130328/12942_1 /TAXON_ID=1104430 /ORGANISM="Chrysoreinhardia sp, Strain CCMP3193" /LENGTH=941 /DNA_ID=CAMNT_0006850579 /DNA_START=64 /DNA_END=2885 /DNA_ORIENTATION=-
MGVPAFFRWLSEKYPQTLIAVLETRGGEGAVSDEAPPTSNAETDNLYVDMNGIIHPCAHPEDREAPATEEQIFEDVLLYVDRLVNATRPTTLIYLAIDGVAPRAKLNQQRARRWKTAKEAEEKRQVERETRAALVGEAAQDDDDDDDDLKKKQLLGEEAEFDSNVITPGTSFMTRLAEKIRSGVCARQREGRRFWRDVAVVVDDASNAGEGEHKIMRFVRDLRASDGYDPNTSHVLHGLDADLIMLALATHEVNFSILREEILFGRAAKEAEEANKVAREQHALLIAEARGSKHWVFTKPLQILRISILREYLRVEFQSAEAQCGTWFDFERAVDDFVFLCFFCGNDFIPHLPSLDIREGALDLLLNTYKAALPAMGGHVTKDGGRVELRRLHELLSRVGKVEDAIFKMRKQAQDDERERRKRQRRYSEPPAKPQGPLSPLGGGGLRGHRGASASPAAGALLRRRLDGTAYSEGALRDAPSEVVDAALKRVIADNERKKLDDAAATFRDDVRLGDDGWKDRYYKGEFKRRDIGLGGGMDKLMHHYVKGLDWILRYYYAGCVSWGWYFPFHYAPFASDLAAYVGELLATIDRQPRRPRKKPLKLKAEATQNNDMTDGQGGETTTQTQNVNDEVYLDEVVSGDLVLGTPLSPLEQLMAVLPAASAHALPGPCRRLMVDKQASPVIDFYPEDVEVDPNGKAMPWLHVVLLPFVDERRLLAAVKDAVAKTTDPRDRRLVEDATRKRDAVVYARAEHALAKLVPRPRGGGGGASEEHQDKKEDAPALIAGELGFPSPDVAVDDLACASLKPVPKARRHLSKILEGAVHPPPVLRGDDRRPRAAPRLSRRTHVAELGLSSAGMNVAGQRSWGSFEPSAAPLKRKHRIDPDHPLIQPRRVNTPPQPQQPQRQNPGRHSFGRPAPPPPPPAYAYYPTYDRPVAPQHQPR